MELQLDMPIQFTPSAIGEIKRLMDEKEAEGRMLRVGVKGGGCSGMTYVLEFDQPNEKDKQYEISGIPFIIDPAHDLYLHGMTIDWSGGLNARGFTFQNPNASTTCGCGTSFAV